MHNTNYLMKKKNFHLFYKMLLNQRSFIYCNPKQKILFKKYKLCFISTKLAACMSTT